MKVPFQHSQSAHCETGVLSNLLSHHGLTISEAMVFGIGSGLFFGYFPFIRLNGLPLTAFRSSTGGIMKRATQRLGVEMAWQKFRNPDKAMAALDEKLAEGTPVGCRTGAFWLSYFPRKYRFHFNMHNLVVYGKDGADYLISDPVFSEPVICPADSLKKARFAQGPMSPKGRMYQVTHVPELPDFHSAILKGIKEVCRTMLKAPGPFLGVKGVRYLAKKLETYPKKLGEKKAALYLGQIIRMQEEIGTGGAGFRFIFAAFLQEAADIMGEDTLHDLSQKMTEAGDRWRDFAVMGGRICKGRAETDEHYPALAAIVRDCAEKESALLKDLAAVIH